MSDHKKISILIIDDDADFCSMMRIHLSAAGYLAQAAEDAVEGGKALLAHHFDLVICDVKMPYMDGIELLKLLRTDEQTSKIPMILISGHSNAEAMGRALEAGAADYLTKPVTRDELLDSVADCLKKSRA
jgi:CheY-like chemotaxis protein